MYTAQHHNPTHLPASRRCARLRSLDALLSLRLLP